MKNSLLVYASKISQIYKKDVWLKLEILNPTGSHKDRESVLLIKEAKKKNFKSIGCASTGNLAISLAFFSKIYQMKSNIWLREKDINIDNLKLIKSLGSRVFIKKVSNLINLASVFGSTSAKILFRGKPAQGTVIDHASTHLNL